MAVVKVNAEVTEEADGSYWAEVGELPGCFASGHTFDELEEALLEAIEMCLPDGVELTPSVERVGETGILVTG